MGRIPVHSMTKDLVSQLRLGRTLLHEKKAYRVTLQQMIVTTESRTVKLPCFLPAIAHTVAIQGCAAGWIRLDDCSLVNLWTKWNGNSAVGAQHRQEALNF